MHSRSFSRQNITLFSAANRPSRSAGCSGVESDVAFSITVPSFKTVPLSRSATHSFSAQISANARVASCWSSGATHVQNCPPRFLACISNKPSSVRPLHQRSYALFHRKTSMKPTGRPSTPCMNGDSGSMRLPRRVLTMAETAANADARNVACNGPCSRFTTHSGVTPMTVLNSESRPNSSGFWGPRRNAPAKEANRSTVKPKSLPVSVGSRVTQSRTAAFTSCSAWFKICAHAAFATALSIPDEVMAETIRL